jgi:hypothetical protein
MTTIDDAAAERRLASAVTAAANDRRAIHEEPPHQVHDRTFAASVCGAAAPAWRAGRKFSGRNNADRAMKLTVSRWSQTWLLSPRHRFRRIARCRSSGDVPPGGVLVDDREIDTEPAAKLRVLDRPVAA